MHLRLGAAKRDGGDTLPVVQRQEPPAAAPDDTASGAGPESPASGAAGSDGEGSAREKGADWVGELLATAAGRVLDERFTPSPGQHCQHCAFRSACSALPEGRQIVE